MTIQDRKILIAVKLKDALRDHANIGRAPSFKEIMEYIFHKCFEEVKPETVKSYLRVWETERKSFLNEIRSELIAHQVEANELGDFDPVPMTFVNRVEIITDQPDELGAGSYVSLAMGHGFNPNNTGAMPKTKEHAEYLERCKQYAKAHYRNGKPVHGKVLDVALPFRKPKKIAS